MAGSSDISVWPLIREMGNQRPSRGISPAVPAQLWTVISPLWRLGRRPGEASGCRRRPGWTEAMGLGKAVLGAH